MVGDHGWLSFRSWPWRTITIFKPETRHRWCPHSASMHQDYLIRLLVKVKRLYRVRLDCGVELRWIDGFEGLRARARARGFSFSSMPAQPVGKHNESVWRDLVDPLVEDQTPRPEKKLKSLACPCVCAHLWHRSTRTRHRSTGVPARRPVRAGPGDASGRGFDAGQRGAARSWAC